MTAPALITVVYPATPSLQFDLEYYIAKHIPMVEKTWKPYGLKQAFVADLRAADGPYAIQCTMVFDTGVDGFQKAVKEVGAGVMADVKNFSNVKAVHLVGPVVTSV
ncbi:hypothetical protein NKR23_g9357 [Pleurostoma richardsiae]|uniref:EthD domain-containing protein n=1 Tax=Pleurostoma richardsiae TaxID=41990 RepID=A0AA38VK50_9PEZI|nr:hypothetical protein NKR23_g9357 [Pleurostoma richardsiae]